LRDPLRLLVGIAAIAAPMLHVATDVMEWRQGGFSDVQLWLNYVAFLPMPWLLLGIYAVHEPRPAAYGLAGALLYGAAFTYFAFTTLYAIADGFPDYASLWQRTGETYTLHGAIMVAGGSLFGVAMLRARRLPAWPIRLFLAGLAVNLAFAIIPVPEAAQMIGSTVRNFGLAGMGVGLLRHHRARGESP